MKVIYIAGPYSSTTHLGREQNILNARSAGAEVCRMGAVPIIPHSNTAHLDDVADLEFFYQAGLEFVRRSDAVLLIPGWDKSAGSHRERELAIALCLPVFLSLNDLGNWLRRFEVTGYDIHDADDGRRIGSVTVDRAGVVEATMNLKDSRGGSRTPSTPDPADEAASTR